MSRRSALSMYEMIQNDIIQKIEKGVYHAGDRIPSEKELMDTWNVSRITATKVLNELSLSGYIHRIQGKGSFANALSSHLVSGDLPAFSAQTFKEADRPYKIGLVLPCHQDSHIGSIIQGVVSTLTYPEYFVNIILCQHKEQEDFSLNHLIRNQYAGIILFPVNFEFYSDIILQMTLNKYPFVLVDRIFPAIHCMSVTSNNELGCRLGITHLYSLGHQRIAYICDSSYREQVVFSRYEGFQKEVSRLNLSSIAYEDFFESDDAQQKQQDFLHNVRNKNITAVIASNAVCAAKLLSLCSQEGIRIPEDISVVCFDNPNAYDCPVSSFFTYIDQSSMNMGIQAADLLKQAIHSDSHIECQQIVFEPKLVVHHSTQALDMDL